MQRQRLEWALGALLTVAMPLFAASPVDPLREQLKQCSQHDNAQGAGVLCGVLSQAVGAVKQFGANRHALREWEELLIDTQVEVSRLRSPEAVGIFVMGLQRMDSMSQTTILQGLLTHPASSELDDAVLKLLKNTRDFQVQVACMELLSTHKYTAATEEILRHLKPEVIVALQVASARALARLGDPKAMEPLIEYLRSMKGSRMRFEATAALRAISGQEFNQDAGTWQGWWDKQKAGFTAKPGEPVFNYETLNTGKTEEELSYYEIPLVENRLVFVLDVSGSMQLGGDPNRLDRARTEMKELINRLPEKTLFNIITYSNATKRWMRDPVMVQATAHNKKQAQAFLDDMRPGGGTETTWALEEALREISLINGVETIFLISDGAPMPLRHWMPTVKALSDLPPSNNAIRRRIKFINSTLKVRIHTIGIYTRAAGDPTEQGQESMKAFLEGIAKDNDGVYKEVN